MKKIIYALLFSTAITLPATSTAELKEYNLGWTNLTPCSKITNDRTSLGFTLPTVRTAPQEYHLYVQTDLPADSTIQAAAGECALLALGACGVAAYATAGAACWPSFVAAFKACAVTRFDAASAKAVATLTPRGEAICRW